jgi:hypothetical protein
MSDPGVGHVRIAYWNPASEPDIPGELEKLEWHGHVRVRGRTCPAKLIGTWSGDWICLDISNKLVWKYVFDDLHFTNSLDASPLIVRSS